METLLSEISPERLSHIKVVSSGIALILIGALPFIYNQRVLWFRCRESHILLLPTLVSPGVFLLFHGYDTWLRLGLAVFLMLVEPTHWMFGSLLLFGRPTGQNELEGNCSTPKK